VSSSIENGCARNAVSSAVNASPAPASLPLSAAHVHVCDPSFVATLMLSTRIVPIVWS
jgi:hypothetical protein